jgi:hypothetical protein
MDAAPAPDPAIFVLDLQEKFQNFNKIFKSFSAYYFFKVHLHHFSMLKIIKKSQNTIFA